MMSSPAENREMLTLETDLPLSPEDLQFMNTQSLGRCAGDLSAYLDFLEEIGAFESKKGHAEVYAQQFTL
jgi:hypothetical protein